MLPIKSRSYLQSANLVQSNLNLLTKISTIVLVTFIIFFQDFRLIINNALQNEATNYLLAVPLIFLYLLYRKRKIVFATISFQDKAASTKINQTSTVAGILLTIGSILLYWGGSYTFNPLEYHLLALPLFLTGLLLILFNIKTTRQLIFPMAFLLFLIPPPTTILYSIGSMLSGISSEISYSIVNFLGINSNLINEIGKPITIEIMKINEPTMIFSVDVACSGIYSLIAFFVFIVLILYIIRDKSLKKFILLFIGFPLLIIMNTFRIMLILLIGYQFGQDIALYLFHLLGGWFLVFFGTLLLLTFSEKILKTKIFTNSKNTCQECAQNKLDTFCMPCEKLSSTPPINLNNKDIIRMLTIILCAILLVSIQVPVFTLTEVSAEVINFSPSGEQRNELLLPAMPDYTLHFYGRDYTFEQVAKQDASLIYYYKPLDTSKENIWAGIEIGSADSKLHNWEYCLITYPTQLGQKVEIVQLALEEIPIQEPVMVTRYFVYKNTTSNVVRAVLYWKTEVKFQTNEMTENKFVKISLWTYPNSEQNLAELEKLIPFAKAIANYLEAPQSLSPVSLFLAKNGINLSLFAFTLAIFSLYFYRYENKKILGMNSILYQKLSNENQRIIDLVSKVQNENLPTLGALTSAYQQTTSAKISKDDMFEILSQAETTGIITRDIINFNDEPIQIWKTVLDRNQDK